MSLSFDDKESFIEAAGSLRINNPPSDSGSSSTGSSTNPQDSEIFVLLLIAPAIPKISMNTIYPTYKLLIISRISFLLGRSGCGGINELPIDSSRKEIQVSWQYRFSFAPELRSNTRSLYQRNREHHPITYCEHIYNANGGGQELGQVMRLGIQRLLTPTARWFLFSSSLPSPLIPQAFGATPSTMSIPAPFLRN